MADHSLITGTLQGKRRRLRFLVSNVNIPKGRTQYDALLDAKEVENFSNSLLDHA